MTGTSELVKAVKQILLRDWDPIGVQNVAQAQDEYDVYASPIAAMLTTRISIDDLSKYLLDSETRSMGLAGHRARAVAVAHKLYGLKTL